MGLKIRKKQSVSREYTKRYQRSNKKNRSILLKEFIELTGYRRGSGRGKKKVQVLFFTIEKKSLPGLNEKSIQQFHGELKNLLKVPKIRPMWCTTKEIGAKNP